MKQNCWKQTEVLPDAAAQSEYRVLNRCDIGPRSVERSRVDSNACKNFPSCDLKIIWRSTLEFMLKKI
jgi:hypothetical protein